jgi:hypothetical protein
MFTEIQFRNAPPRKEERDFEPSLQLALAEDK